MASNVTAEAVTYPKAFTKLAQSIMKQAPQHL